MSEVGVTQTGFQIKPFQDILNDKAARASELFGADVDLRSTSALRKVLDVTSAEDQELWKQMEGFYYSNFISTASGDALDRLGEDVGVDRRFLNATGKIKLKLSGEAPGRLYSLPIGTLVETDAPGPSFRTSARVTLFKPEQRERRWTLRRHPAARQETLRPARSTSSTRPSLAR